MLPAIIMPLSTCFEKPGLLGIIIHFRVSWDIFPFSYTTSSYFHISLSLEILLHQYNALGFTLLLFSVKAFYLEKDWAVVSLSCVTLSSFWLYINLLNIEWRVFPITANINAYLKIIQYCPASFTYVSFTQTFKRL